MIPLCIITRSGTPLSRSKFFEGRKRAAQIAVAVIRDKSGENAIVFYYLEHVINGAGYCAVGRHSILSETTSPDITHGRIRSRKKRTQIITSVQGWHCKQSIASYLFGNGTVPRDGSGHVNKKRDRSCRRKGPNPKDRQTHGRRTETEKAAARKLLAEDGEEGAE